MLGADRGGAARILAAFLTQSILVRSMSGRRLATKASGLLNDVRLNYPPFFLGGLAPPGGGGPSGSIMFILTSNARDGASPVNRLYA